MTNDNIFDPDKLHTGGIFELHESGKCLDPEHDMPTHMSIPAGCGYTHVCPRCGYTQTVTNPIIY